MPLEVRDLSAARGLLFRITHVDNVPWLLAHGLHPANGQVSDPRFVPIGNPDLIAKRADRPMPSPPGGTLSDYIPFYFTPKSVMALNIKTGKGGATLRPNEHIAILVSSCAAMACSGVTMLYSDRHAYTKTARFSDNSADLETMIDWGILRAHDFARSEDDPDKKERYQAEALAHRYVPSAALLGIACVADSLRRAIEQHVLAAGLRLSVAARPNWFF